MKVNVLIDSYGWIEYFSDGPLAGKYSKYIESSSKKKTFTPSIILYEVYKRIKKFKGEQVALTAYAYIVAHTAIVPIGKKIALEAAETSISEDLGMADSIIRSTAQIIGAKIITSDKHFKGKKDVIFIS